MKNNKGITLIALVITIIVMLILVTVTIQVATNGNLFTHAGNAAKGTKKAIEEENALLDGSVGGTSIEDIVAEQTTQSGQQSETPAVTTISFTIAGVSYTATEEMSWVDWVADENYNTAGFYTETNSNSVFFPIGGGHIKNVAKTDIISNNGVYIEADDK